VSVVMILPCVVYMYLTSFRQTKTLPSCVPAGAELVDCFSCMYFVLFYCLMLLILCAVLAVKLLFSDYQMDYVQIVHTEWAIFNM